MEKEEERIKAENERIERENERRREKEKKIRDVQKGQIQKWKEAEQRERDEKKSYEEMLNFQKRQEFTEKLPILQESILHRLFLKNIDK